MIELADMILETAKIYEEGWSQREKKYTLTLYKASDQAASNLNVDGNICYPVYLLLSYCWNDAIEWAGGVKK